MKIVLSSASVGAGAGAALDVVVLSSAGADAARIAEGGIAASGASAAQGLLTYEAPLHDDTVISIRAVLADGRASAAASKTVRTNGQCVGEAVFDAAAAAASPAAAAPAPAGAEAQPEPGPPASGSGQAQPEPEPPAARAGQDGDAPASAAKDGQGAGQPPGASGGGGGAQPEPAPAPAPADAPDDGDATNDDAAPPPPPLAAEPDASDAPSGGGCLVATAAYGTEMAPQVQALREFRDTAVLQSAAGAALMSAFNTAYYAVSPQIADLEREHPAFRDAVRALIAPLLYLAHAASLAEPGSLGVDVLAYGAAAAAVAVALYAAAPVAAAQGRLGGGRNGSGRGSGSGRPADRIPPAACRARPSKAPAAGAT